MLIMNVRIPGKTLYLGIGRGSEYCGIWDMPSPVPSTHRIQRDKFLEYLRSNVVGKNIIDVQSDHMDRSIKIIFHDQSEALFFWKGRRLHFTHLEKKNDSYIEFSPWETLKKSEVYYKDTFEVFDKIGRKQLSEKDMGENCLFPDTDKLFSGKAADGKIVKKLKRKVSLIEGDLKKCQLWKELQDLAINDQLDLSSDKMKWNGIKMKFERGSHHYQRRNTVFEKVKKLRKGEEVLLVRLEEARQELAGKTNSDGVVIESMVFPVWVKKDEKKAQQQERKDGCIFLEWNDLKIALGTTAQANDHLRKVWAKKNDLWFHLDEYKSSHLFVKGVESPSIEQISTLSSILAEYSGFKDSQIPVIYTKVSNLKGVKGVAGLVNYKKEKHLIVQAVNWKEIISTSW